MADEDELFAQFIGEINSTVVEPAEDGGDASDTASVGEVEGGGTISDNTARGKASMEASPLPETKKPKVMGKLVAAALPMKAGTAGAVAPKPAASRTEATKSLAISGPSARPPSKAAKVSKDGSARYGTSSASERRKDGAVAVPAGNTGKTQGFSTRALVSGEKHDNGGAPRGDARGGGGGGGDGDGRTLPEANGVHQMNGSGGMQGQHPGASRSRGHVGMPHTQMAGAMMPGNNGMGLRTGGGPMGMGMNMAIMGDSIGGDFGGGYGMPPVMSMGMGMGMSMGMGMASGIDTGPYAGGSVGYVYGGQINGMGPIAAGGVEDGTAAAGRAAAAAATVEGGPEEGTGAKGKRKETKASEAGAKKFKRVAGGTSWEDVTLADWPENDYRLFVGDLGNEVTDEHLAGAFRKYASFAKARVIREKWNKKSKGYGFVSFLDGMDMLKALREQNGKYLGNRPMKINKSTWRERDAKEVRKRNKKAKKVKKQLGML